MFGRATIRLGIGPHSSFCFVFVSLLAVMHRWIVVHLASSCMRMQSVTAIWLTSKFYLLMEDGVLSE